MIVCVCCKRINPAFKSFREGEVCHGCWLAATTRVTVHVIGGVVLHEDLKVNRVPAQRAVRAA